MHQFALVCVGIYTLMSAGVGARLVLRGFPTRRAPELLMGIAYLAAPGFGYPLVVVGSTQLDRAGGLLAFALGEVMIALGVSCFFFFNARVFRAKSVAAQSAAALGAILFSLSCGEIVRGHMALGAGAMSVTSVRTASVTMLIVLGFAYAWTAFEGFRYHRMMRRRARVGLGDPVVANRFLLWAFAGGLQVISDVVAAYSLQSGGNITVDAAPVLATSLVGIVNSVFLVLIFIPPARYTRWLMRDPRGALAAV
ncbi:MAG: hypothetical protein ACHQ6T_13530 [Myxococcota bacterium]